MTPITETSGLDRDPETEYADIARWLGSIEFAWDIERALEFALFRTYAVPSISGLLARTGKFEAAPRKRYDDTELLLSEPMEHGLDSERGRAAVERLNAIHGRFRISNEDMRYVLSTFVCEPVRWCAENAKRKFKDHEVRAWTNYYIDLGSRMGITDLPSDFAGFEALNRDYGASHFQFAETNKKIADASVELLLGFYLPRSLFPLGRPVIRAMMDDPLLEAMGYEPAPWFVKAMVRIALDLRAAVVRLLPRRRRPLFLTQRKRPTYPGGYLISELGNGPEQGSVLRRQASN
ncbi:oxygenase MpaB family protein [Maritimibacter dapengensis]|uniref:DUF2236 domain-containing protein n=1 Tax=Maritimibacter dapengensis TaxID=2836868 RepID=A0ABS6T651_9RHOB|nr:oxygenase MpaB family protein [Maritimibacter dapengensis]MBV7380675.1 DUF2236 domain-containing protein [Maritimibacter dapengensis]